MVCVCAIRVTVPPTGCQRRAQWCSAGAPPLVEQRLSGRRRSMHVRAVAHQQSVQGVWPVLVGTPWSETVKPLAQALHAQLQQRSLQLVAKAYANIQVDQAAAVVGMSPDAIVQGDYHCMSGDADTATPFNTPCRGHKAWVEAGRPAQLAGTSGMHSLSGVWARSACFVAQVQEEPVSEAAYGRGYQQLQQLTEYVLHFQSDAGHSAM